MEKTKMITKLASAAFISATVFAPMAHAADTAATGGTSSKTAQKAGAYVDDSVITAKVKSAFVEDNQVSALKIKVVTKQGVVTLKGNVPTAEAGQHALQVAAGIDGVKDVKSELIVKSA
ncbi:BON domain-containing protein [Herbaspirillum lusitanum]|uniref:BON domain-containing protein n=1 Tax=Herbaspirillum lusitanum TaxID=213312 RepID=A0ABW9AHW6_9BURK